MRITRAVSLVVAVLGGALFPAACATRSQPPVAATPAPPPPPTASPSAAPGHVGPASLYPDPLLTPGKFDTESLADLNKRYPCPSSIHQPDCTYSQAHRSVNANEHTLIYDEYHVPANQRNIQNGEVDHLDPLCNGGSNDKENLWFQPIHAMWNGKDFGFKTKDRLEAFICIEVKAQRMDPKVAYDKMTSDWVQFYLDNESKLPKNGGGVQ